MTVAAWSADERRLTLASGVAPLAISVVLASTASLLTDSTEALLLFVALVPAAYLTLFAFVLPGLWLLRRLRQERLWSFVAVCGLGVVLPWLALYAMCLGDPASGKWAGATVQVAEWLLLPGMLAALSGGVIYRVFGPR